MIPMDIRTDRYERRKSRAEEVVCEVAEAIIVRAALDAMSDYKPTKSSDTYRVAEAVEYFRKRNYRGHAAMAGINEETMERCRSAVLAKHGGE